MKLILITLLFFAYSGSIAHAAAITVVQGDVLRIKAPENAPDKLQVEAFGQTWPIYHHQGNRIAWVGIDLQTKPNSYKLTWRSRQQQWHDVINVLKGDFRISHIKVEKKMATFDAKTLKRIRADQKAIKKAYKSTVDIKNSWPEMVLPTAGIISTPFAAQRYVNGKPRSPHSGIDIAAVEGTPVQSPLAGTVLLVSDMYLNGTLVAIGHGDGLTTIYAHLKQSLVKEGQHLKQGDIFAEVGSTGRSTGPHLHWGVHFAGSKVNPRAMLNTRLQQEMTNN